MDIMEGPGVQESWNMAMATMKRFDFILKQCSVSSQSGNLVQWKINLMDLRRNLYPFMGETEFDDVNKKFNSLPRGWMKKGNVHPQAYAMTNKILDEIHMIFVKVMKDKGLLMPKTVDSGKAVIEM